MKKAYALTEKLLLHLTGPAETGLWTRTKGPYLEQADRRLGCLLKVLFATLSGLPRVLRRTNVATCGTLAGDSCCQVLRIAANRLAYSTSVEIEGFRRLGQLGICIECQESRDSPKPLLLK
jgi:hypothetical protein